MDAPVYTVYTCKGDGNAMLLRSGLLLQGCECMQFHLSGIYGFGWLISEGARGKEEGIPSPTLKANGLWRDMDHLPTV